MYDAANLMKSRGSLGALISTVTPFSRSASTRTVSAKRLGSGTEYLKRIAGLPAGTLPVIVTVCVPFAFRASTLQRISGSESGFPVVARLTKVTYEVAGDDLKTTGAPSAAPGPTVTSTMLSFTTIGDMTTPVPSSRSEERRVGKGGRSR